MYHPHGVVFSDRPYQSFSWAAMRYAAGVLNMVPHFDQRDGGSPAQAEIDFNQLFDHWTGYRQLMVTQRTDYNELFNRLDRELMAVSDTMAVTTDAEWTDWKLTKIVKPWFKGQIDSPSGWTNFANQLRDKNQLENHPTTGPRKIRLRLVVFSERNMGRPDLGPV